MRTVMPVMMLVAASAAAPANAATMLEFASYEVFESELSTIAKGDLFHVRLFLENGTRRGDVTTYRDVVGHLYSGTTGYSGLGTYIYNSRTAETSFFSNDGQAGFSIAPPGRPVARLNRLFGVTLGDYRGVPEPATWAMMIAGFGLAGGAMRRHRGRLAASHA